MLEQEYFHSDLEAISLEFDLDGRAQTLSAVLNTEVIIAGTISQALFNIHASVVVVRCRGKGSDAGSFCVASLKGIPTNRLLMGKGRSS
jgi:hypothetical protein